MKSINCTKLCSSVDFLVNGFTPFLEKRDRQYIGRNFDKFRKLFVIFGTNYPDNPCD